MIQTINKFTPFAFQEKTIVSAISAVNRYGGCCIFDETGLGKTITGAHIAINVGERILVVSPKANQKGWTAVLPDAVVCTKQKVVDGEFDVVVVDEAHNFNSAKNKSFRALIETIYFRGNKFPKVILLTATPVNNNIGEFINMLKLIPFGVNTPPFYTVSVAGHAAIVAEKELKKIERFSVDPETGIGTTFKNINEHVEAQFAFRRSLEVLGGTLKEFCFRTTRTEISNDFSGDAALMGHFPKIAKENVPVNLFFGVEVQKTLEILDKMPLAFYNIGRYIGRPNDNGLGGIIRTFLMKRLDSSIAAFKETLENMLNNLNGILSSGVVQMDGESVGVDGGFWADLKKDVSHLNKIKALWGGKVDGEKLAMLKSIIDSHPDEKIVIFSEYVATQKTISDFLLNSEYKFLVYNGASDEKLLDTIANEFDRNCVSPSNKYQILIATDALAEGVNLHQASILIHYDLKWNPSRLIQREGRINRLVRFGLSPNDVTVYAFGVDSLVERVVRLENRLSNKSDMANAVLNSAYVLDFIQNAEFDSYFFKNKGFYSLVGVKFDVGTLFFKYNDLHAADVKLVKQSDLPVVRVKKNQKKTEWWFKSLFKYRENVGYEWRVSNIQNYFDITDSNYQKLYAIFRNHQYGWLFMLDGKRDEVKNLYRKFAGEIPDCCELSAYEGDVVLNEVRFF